MWSNVGSGLLGAAAVIVVQIMRQRRQDKSEETKAKLEEAKPYQELKMELVDFATLLEDVVTTRYRAFKSNLFDSVDGVPEWFDQDQELRKLNDLEERHLGVRTRCKRLSERGPGLFPVQHYLETTQRMLGTLKRRGELGLWDELTYVHEETPRAQDDLRRAFEELDAIVSGYR